MILLIPIDEEKNLCSVKANSSWAVVTFDEGKTQNIDFYNNKEDIKEYIDYVIVQNQNECVDDFLDEGFGILVAPMQKSIDDIIEAYMFRELHELGS